MDEELRVDEHVADDDEAGGEDPAVQPHHQHRRHVQAEQSSIIIVVILTFPMGNRYYRVSGLSCPEAGGCNSAIL